MKQAYLGYQFFSPVIHFDCSLSDRFGQNERRRLDMPRSDHHQPDGLDDSCDLVLPISSSPIIPESGWDFKDLP
jgi:hypothetical protein